MQRAIHRHPRPAGTRRRGGFRHFALIAGLCAMLSVGGAGLATQVLHAHSSPAAAPPPPAPLLSADQPPQAKYVVVMVLDGARPDYLQVPGLTNLNALAKSGTEFTKGMSGLLEAETPSGHAAIGTGSRPDLNGILGFDWANDNDRYSLFDPNKMSDLLSVMAAAGAPTLGGLVKAHDPSAKVVSLSGHKYYAAAPMGGPSADAIIFYQGNTQGQYVPAAVPGHVPPGDLLTRKDLTDPTTREPAAEEDHLTARMAVAAFQEMKPRVLTINFPEFDWPLGHVNGGSLDPALVGTLMRGFDTDLGKIEDAYRKAGVLDQTVFVVTADHGMMPIKGFISPDIANKAIQDAGTTAPDIASNTGDYIWLAEQSKAQSVAQSILAAHNSGIQSAYYVTTSGGAPHYVQASGSNVDTAGDHANQYLLSGLINGHEPSVVVFAKEGYTFSDPKSNWKADHGGNSWESQHLPLIFSGAGVRNGVKTDAAAQLDDIAPTLLSLMGIQPAGMEGHILTDAQENPTPFDETARKSEAQDLSANANALISESQ